MLSQTLSRAIEAGVQEAADAIRELVNTVTLRRNNEGGLSIEIEIRLNALLGLGSSTGSTRVPGERW